MSALALTTNEAKLLAEKEQVIQSGLQTFVEVGEALAEIRDKRLYRATHPDDFEGYCRERWGMVQQTATRLIRAAKVTATLTTEPMGSVPQSERQARPLTQLSNPEQQREAWQEAVTASGGKPTAKHVQAAVEKAKSSGSRESGGGEISLKDCASISQKERFAHHGEATPRQIRQSTPENIQKARGTSPRDNAFEVGIGTSTAQRAIITRSALEEIESRVNSPVTQGSRRGFGRVVVRPPETILSGKANPLRHFRQ